MVFEDSGSDSDGDVDALAPLDAPEPAEVPPGDDQRAGAWPPFPGEVLHRIDPLPVLQLEDLMVPRIDQFLHEMRWREAPPGLGVPRIGQLFGGLRLPAARPVQILGPELPPPRADGDAAPGPFLPEDADGAAEAPFFAGPPPVAPRLGARPVAQPLALFYDYFTGADVDFAGVRREMVTAWHGVWEFFGVEGGRDEARLPDAEDDEWDACESAACRAYGERMGMGMCYSVMSMAVAVMNRRDNATIRQTCRRAWAMTVADMWGEVRSGRIREFIAASGSEPGDDMRYDRLMSEIGQRTVARARRDPDWERCMAQCAILRVMRAVAKADEGIRHESAQDALVDVAWRLVEHFHPMDRVEPEMII